ncbi:DUF6188 family protein [Paractinoplanes durhamensis]|nr:DUF6188 family protein [Actinoplanes durhamensis]
MTDARPRPALPLDLLIERKLDYVRLDDAIVLSLSGGGQVLIETCAQLTGPHGRFLVEPGVATSDIVATLLGDLVRDARVSDTGDLRITFDSGSELLVEADPEVESWAFVGPDGLLVVCLAGGELARWQR